MTRFARSKPPQKQKRNDMSLIWTRRSRGGRTWFWWMNWLTGFGWNRPGPAGAAEGGPRGFVPNCKATLCAPAVGNRSRAVGSHSPAVGSRSPAVGNDSPAVGSHSPAVGNRSRAVGNRSPAVGSRSRAVGNRFRAEGDDLRAGKCGDFGGRGVKWSRFCTNERGVAREWFAAR